MPNRIIKESICRSDTINGLTAEEEVFFYRLLVQCDDYGRFDARLEILRAACYPLRLDKISAKNIQSWLDQLVKARLVWLYEVDGKAYVQVTTWEKHQQIRAKRSKCPEPPADAMAMQSSDSVCNQRDAYVPVIRIQSESESESESESNIARRKRRQSTPPPLAVKAFREATARYPPRSWYADIDSAVGNEVVGLALWGNICKIWVGHGYNPQNVEGMLECFKRGEIPGRSPRNDGGEPKGWAGLRELERMEAKHDQQGR